MPPKRAASSSSAGTSSRSKKPKTDNNDNSNAPAIPRSNRWSVVSASGNADDSYKLATRDPIRAYSYICICRPLFDRYDEEDDDHDDHDGSLEEDEEGEGASAVESESKNKPQTRCDGGKSCQCSKSAADDPEYVWIITFAGVQKYMTQRIHVDLRCPDHFDMYTYNDHEGYGVLEVVQNLLLDFADAEGNWKEQWVVCEATALFFLSDAIAPMMMIDDADTVWVTHRLIGRMFLAMLAKLERQDLLKPDSEVQNLGLVMAMYIKLAASLRPTYLVSEDEDDKKKPTKGSKKTFKFNCARFDDYVLAYATRCNIKLVGPSDTDDLVAELEEVDLPAAGDDPWGWTAAFKGYVRDHGVDHPGKKARIGGDSLDITTWSKADRAAKSFSKKDPLSKKDIDAIKEGMVLQLA